MTQRVSHYKVMAERQTRIHPIAANWAQQHTAAAKLNLLRDTNTVYGRRRNPSKIFFQYSLLFCNDHTVLVTQNKLSFAAAGVLRCAQLAAMG